MSDYVRLIINKLRNVLLSYKAKHIIIYTVAFSVRRNSMSIFGRMSLVSVFTVERPVNYPPVEMSSG